MFFTERSHETSSLKKKNDFLLFNSRADLPPPCPRCPAPPPPPPPPRTAATATATTTTAATAGVATLSPPPSSRRCTTSPRATGGRRPSSGASGTSTPWQGETNAPNFPNNCLFFCLFDVPPHPTPSRPPSLSLQAGHPGRPGRHRGAEGRRRAQEQAALLRRGGERDIKDSTKTKTPN